MCVCVSKYVVCVCVLVVCVCVKYACGCVHVCTCLHCHLKPTIIDQLQLCHIFRGISVYYPEAAILVYIGFIISIDQNVSCVTGKHLYSSNSLRSYHIPTNSTHTRSIVGT